MKSLPEVLDTTERVCASREHRQYGSGLNMDAEVQKVDGHGRQSYHAQTTECDETGGIAMLLKTIPFTGGCFWGRISEGDVTFSKVFSVPGVVNGRHLWKPAASFEEI